MSNPITYDPLSSVPAEYRPGNIIATWKYRAIIYLALALVALGLTAANGVYAYLIGVHAVATYPVWLGAIEAGFLPVSAAGFGLSRANPPASNTGPVD